MTELGPPRVAARCSVALIGCAAVVVALVHAGKHAVPAPPLGSWQETMRWLDDTEPAGLAMAILRLAAISTGWYVFLVTAATLVASTCGSVRALRTLRQATPRPLRRSLGNVASTGLTASALVVGGLLPARAVTDDPPSPDAHDPRAVATMRSSDDEQTAATATMREVSPAAARPAVETVTVAPGDSLWSITCDVLEDRWGRAPTDREVLPHWQALVEANRSRLVDPLNPDLILPGQRFVLP